MNKRQLARVIKSRLTSDGDGVQILRVPGFDLPEFSPFLMIDELKSDNHSDYVGGFPSHPHRGIETFSYMVKGHFQHKDSMGNKGELKSGGVQWMASGRGIVHSEMPIMENGDLHGFQVWINQPASQKMQPACYQDMHTETIPEYVTEQTGLLRVLAGNTVVDGVNIESTLKKTGVAVGILDWRAQSKQNISVTTTASFNAMIYVYKGQVNFDGKYLNAGELAFLTKGELISLRASKDSGVLILSGQPIKEPIVHYGPFVMNTQEEIVEAISDYNSGQFDRY